MSELKEASCFEFEKVLSGRSNKLFYSKSEADKVIAEKDKEIAELKAACVNTDNSAVIENMANELERLRPMETALELAEADCKGYLARIKELEAKIKELEEERRWRKFSEETPEHHQWILVHSTNHSQFTTGVELRRWDEGCKYDVEFQEIYDKWMPQPSASEGGYYE